MFCRLVFDITTKCNFRCKHCFRSFSEKDVDFNVNSFERILSEAKELRIRGLSLTGGEPLMHENFFDLLSISKKYGIKVFITTNGFLFPKMFDEIKKFKDIIGDISFSLDGSSKEIHDFIRKKGSFKKVMESFDLCKKEGIIYRVVSTINKFNFNDVKNIIKLSIDAGAFDINFSATMPSKASNLNNLALSLEEKEKLYYNLIELKNKFDYPIMMGTDIVGMDYVINCPVFTNTVWFFDPYGFLSFCCELSRNSLLKDKKALQIFDIKKESLKQALKNMTKNYSDFINKRIEDYNKEDDPFFINSCEYCFKKFGIIK